MTLFYYRLMSTLQYNYVSIPCVLHGFFLWSAGCTSNIKSRNSSLSNLTLEVRYIILLSRDSAQKVSSLISLSCLHLPVCELNIMFLRSLFIIISLQTMPWYCVFPWFTYSFSDNVLSHYLSMFHAGYQLIDTVVIVISLQMLMSFIVEAPKYCGNKLTAIQLCFI